MGTSKLDHQHEQPKRALILAGGGLKVAFQAGVLQVWLDEAGLDFILADGASGGALNAAMYAQGMTGTEIANNWRRFDPLRMIGLNWFQLLRIWRAQSLLTFERFRRNIFLDWDLDFYRIRHSTREVTFNAYNFSTHQLKVCPAQQLTEEFLLACIALPMWFPPLEIDGATHIDAVYITDANLEEAIARGANELWIIWTMNHSPWLGGFLAQYFQIIETAANGHLQRVLQRIEKSNAAINAGKQGEFTHIITIKRLDAKVPVHYLINFSHQRMRSAVELGVKVARAWCRQHDYPLAPAAKSLPQAPVELTALKFTEKIKGFVAFGEEDQRRGYTVGRQQKLACTLKLTIYLRDLDQFFADPTHRGRIVGVIDCDALGGERRVESGVVNLLVKESEPTLRTMRYRLFFTDGAGRPLTLSGMKYIRDDPGIDVWEDTTTLFTQIFQGHVTLEEEAQATVVASGILFLSLVAFLRQLTTFRVIGIGPFAALMALLRFGRFFFGTLRQLYHRRAFPLTLLALAVSFAFIAFATPLRQEQAGTGRQRQRKQGGQIDIPSATLQSKPRPARPLANEAIVLRPTTERNGVVLREYGEGKPVCLFAGMEGSGESCLHLVLPVIAALTQQQGQPHRIILVDYSRENHHSLAALVATMRDLVGGAVGQIPSLFWAQSFGNILATAVAQQGDFVIEKFVLVSPFTRLPPFRLRMGALSMGLTPSPLYRATIKPLGHFLFGPVGDQAHHPFFDALQAGSVRAMARRTRWLIGQDFAQQYRVLQAPAKVWLGERDRLVDLAEQQAFFQRLSQQQPNYQFALLPNSGHVVLPSAAVRIAQAELQLWLQQGSPVPS